MSNISWGCCQYPDSPGSPITVSFSTMPRISCGVTPNSAAASPRDT